MNGPRHPRLHPHLRIAVLSAGAAFLTGCVAGKSFEKPREEVLRRTGLEIRRDDPGSGAALPELPEGPLSAESAVRIALRNNRKLRAVFAGLEGAEASASESWRPHNPIFEAEFLKGLRGEPGTEIGLAAAGDLAGLAAAPFRRAAAKAELAEAQYAAAREAIALAVEVEAQYRTVSADQALLALAAESAEAAGAASEAARRIFDAGNLTRLRLGRIEAEEAEARLDRAALEVEARKHRERLVILMGLWGEAAAVRIPPPAKENPAPAPPPEGDVEKLVVQANLELEMLRRRIEASSRRAGLAKVLGPIPEFGAGAAFSREGDGARRAGPLFEFPVPLFNFGGARAAMAKAKLAADLEIFHHKGAEVRAAARAARDHLAVARERAAFSRERLVPLRRAILDDTLREYNAMQAGVFDLLEAKREEIEARRRAVEDERDHWLARIEMNSLLAGHVTAVGMETTPLDSVMGSALH